MTHQFGPGLCTLKQTVTLPRDILYAELSWIDRIRNYASFVEIFQEARVMVCLDDGNGPQEVWSTNPFDENQQIGPNERAFDVTSMLKGKSVVNIQMDEQHDSGPFLMNWDEVSLKVCSIQLACPCENGWKNHGKYVGCVAHASDELVTKGIITDEEKDAIVSDAAKSNCGSKTRLRA